MIEEGELLLIAQHLDGGLPQHGEVQCRPIGGGIGKYDLMRERGFAASRGASDDVEGVLRQAAAQNLIETRNTGRQATNGDSVSLARRRSI